MKWHHCRSVNEVTQILETIRQGDPKAADELQPLVYGELRKLAAAKLAHEAWLRLGGDDQIIADISSLPRVSNSVKKPARPSSEPRRRK